MRIYAEISIETHLPDEQLGHDDVHIRCVRECRSNCAKERVNLNVQQTQQCSKIRHTSLQALKKRAVQRTADRCGTSNLAEPKTAELDNREKRLEQVVHIMLVEWRLVGEPLQLLPFEMRYGRRVPYGGIKQVEQHRV